MITYYDKIVYLIEEMLKDGRGLSTEDMREIIERARPDAFCARYDTKRENKEPVSEAAIKRFLRFCSDIEIVYTEKIEGRLIYYRIKDFDTKRLEQVLAPKIPEHLVDIGGPNLHDIINYLGDCMTGEKSPIPGCFTSEEIWRHAGKPKGGIRKGEVPDGFNKCLIILQGIKQLAYWRRWLFMPPE